MVGNADRSPPRGGRRTALSRAGYAIVATGLQHCLADAGEEGIDAVDVKKIEKLFLALA